MVERPIIMSDYNNWTLDSLRSECTCRGMEINPKDGVKTLAARLRVDDDKLSQAERADRETNDLSEHKEDINVGEFEQIEDNQNFRDVLGDFELTSEKFEPKQMGEIPSGALKSEHDSRNRGNSLGQLSFQERMELLRFQREIEREREEREIRREERRKSTKLEEAAMTIELNRESQASWRNKPIKFIQMREMRENEDIDDFFRVFEMTAQTQCIPRYEWLGSLIPRLSEKAKSIHLEITGDEAKKL